MYSVELSPQKENGGVIMVNLYSDLVSSQGHGTVSAVAGKASAPTSHSVVSAFCVCVCVAPDFKACVVVFCFADHFDHIRKTIGAKSIGIAGDYEGVLR